MKTATLVLGNQLFDPKLVKRLAKGATHVFMREDQELCTYYKFHKQKIIFFLSAMRAHAKELEKAGFDVHYEKMNDDGLTYDQALRRFLKKNKIERVTHFEIEDKFFEKRIAEALAGFEVEVWDTPMFLTTRDQFRAYLNKSKRPFMKTFYESQRKRLGILLDKKGQPTGGRWSFDEQNRKPLPKKIQPPPPKWDKPDADTRDVMKLTEQRFGKHPGQAADLWLPTDRKGARKWLDLFLNERLPNFGPYEDAIPVHSDFVFHSVISPLINVGLLTPAEVIERILEHAEKRKLTINSIEGFVRQVIGWREFVRGIYRNYSEKQDTTNFWKHKKKLSKHWYAGDTGIPPLDHAIKKILRYGWAHHIERLMVAGNLMLLLEVEPREAHRWYMEMFVDSSDWVMGPNVYGMGIFSDGGIFATKPYICGSNYYRKMGGYPKGEWCDGVDGLYWNFVEKHEDFFARNPRMSIMVKAVTTMDKDRKKRLTKAADELRARLVTG